MWVCVSNCLYARFARAPIFTATVALGDGRRCSSQVIKFQTLYSKRELKSLCHFNHYLTVLFRMCSIRINRESSDRTRCIIARFMAPLMPQATTLLIRGIHFPAMTSTMKVTIQSLSPDSGGESGGTYNKSYVVFICFVRHLWSRASFACVRPLALQ